MQVVGLGLEASLVGMTEMGAGAGHSMVRADLNKNLDLYYHSIKVYITGTPPLTRFSNNTVF